MMVRAQPEFRRDIFLFLFFFLCFYPPAYEEKSSFSLTTLPRIFVHVCSVKFTQFYSRLSAVNSWPSYLYRPCLHPPAEA